MKMIKKIGIIDIGSNSIRLVIYEIYSDNTFKLIEDVKESVRLGDGLRGSGQLKAKRMDMAYHTMMIYKNICDRNYVDSIVAFATAAIRNSSNSRGLLDTINKELGIDIKVFSGRDEATASFYGAINTLDIDEGLLMDMGGASTELVWFRDRVIYRWVSLNFGSVTIAELIDTQKALSSTKELKLRRYIRDKLDNIPWLTDIKKIPLIGVGGTIRNLAKVDSSRKKYPLLQLHNYRIDIASLEERLNLRGLARSRADIFTGALLAIGEIMSYGALEEIIISSSGIREGVLYRELYTSGIDRDHVFTHSLMNTLNHFNIDHSDGEKIYEIFTKVLASLNIIHRYDNINLNIIKTVCFLGKIGVRINYLDYPIHSHYMILNSNLKGISHRNLVKSSLIASQQFKKNNLYERYSRVLEGGDIEEIDCLSVIYRISKLLYRIFSLDSSGFNIEVQDDKVTFRIFTRELLDIQVSNLLMSNKRFKEIFNRDISIEKGLL